MAKLKPTDHPLTPYLLVSSTVLLQLAAAWVLDTAAGHPSARGWAIAAVAIAVALVLNVGRFVIWGYTHRHFPLSFTYPLTALFFPCILLLSYFQGTRIGGMEILGTALITIGAVVMGVRDRTAVDDA